MYSGSQLRDFINRTSAENALSEDEQSLRLIVDSSVATRHVKWDQIVQLTHGRQTGRYPEAGFWRAGVAALGELGFEGVDFLDSRVAHHQRRSIAGRCGPVAGHVIWTAKLS